MKSIKLVFIDPPRSPSQPHPPWGLIFAPEELSVDGQEPNLALLWKHFGSHYGYALLLGQGLHFGLTDLLRWYNLRRMLDKRPHRGDSEIDSLSFENCIHETAQLFDVRDSQTKAFISQLHAARKIRNRLSHRVYDCSSLDYFASAGGLLKKIDELKGFERVFSSVSTVVHSLAKAYQADCGLSSELVDAISQIDKFDWEQFSLVLVQLNQEDRLKFCRDLLAKQEQQDKEELL